MTTSDLQERDPQRPRSEDRVGRILGHPLAYLATAVILLGVFAGPFIADPDRVAPTKDPAFYTWRTEAFLTEEPADLLAIEGPEGMFAAGYRVAAPILGGLLRHVADVHSLTVMTLLMVSLPVLISLLLAGFAHRELPDPLLWHAVAFVSAGLLLTPPFVGYLDNVLCLFFLAAALHFLRSARGSWGARVMLFIFLLLAGLSHPTTLVIFCGTLGLMAAARLLLRRWDLKATLREDGWMLGVAFAAAVATFLVWTIGIWGRSVSLSEAALPPPYGSAFFVDRMLLWIDAMRPVLNGPLLVIGIVGLVTSGWRALDRELARVSLLGLAPLVGLFGFVAGLAYPYYRFFNTTLAWVLLTGIGAGIAARLFLDRARDGGVSRLAFFGVVAIVVIAATNLTHGLAISGWTKEKNQWLEPETRRDLDELRDALAFEDRASAVVFVIDDEPPEPFQIYGFSKLSGNTSRYGLPPGQIDRGYLYLGGYKNLLQGEPTRRGDATYDDLSAALLEDTQRGIGAAPPIIVVAEAFNPAGANVAIASGDEPVPDASGGTFADETKVWTLHDGALYEWTPGGRVGRERSGLPPEDPGPIHLAWVVVGIALLFLPGLIVLRRLPGAATWAQGIGLVPALGCAIAITSGVVVVAFLREPFTGGSAGTTIVLAVVVSLLPAARRRARPV